MHCTQQIRDKFFRETILLNKVYAVLTGRKKKQVSDAQILVLLTWARIQHIAA